MGSHLSRVHGTGPWCCQHYHLSNILYETGLQQLKSHIFTKPVIMVWKLITSAVKLRRLCIFWVFMSCFWKTDCKHSPEAIWRFQTEFIFWMDYSLTLKSHSDKWSKMPHIHVCAIILTKENKSFVFIPFYVYFYYVSL